MEALVSDAAVFALVTSGALIAGAFTGMRWMPPEPLLASILAFAAGALTSALAFELFEESFTKGGLVLSGAGFAAGAGVFVIVDVLLKRRRTRAGGSAVGLALLAGVILDGVPENLALGTTLAASDGSLALLAAIVASNFPEALVGARSMCEDGRSVRFSLGTWCIAALVLATAIIAGSSLLQGLDERALSVILAFAGGAVLSSVANTLFPRAFQDGGPWVTLATVAGFLVAFTLGSIG
ncbi:MAG: zinc permease [Actinomycetota bacterium]|nr:zinc permease [Actinomycetota bacterium]